ncbi:MAG: T9SS C-terminal target domain-containing protein, partial [Rubricoccaceae bacterium]|nr:T9SS C-terminal target domain-containing protein [Rubricoccaceae bacterium]
ADVRLAVYDVLGREVAVLVDARVEAGTHRAVFEAGDLAAGLYVYRLQVGTDVRTGRMTLAR